MVIQHVVVSRGSILKERILVVYLVHIQLLKSLVIPSLSFMSFKLHLHLSHETIHFFFVVPQRLIRSANNMDFPDLIYMVSSL
jgi:hypothetical protein